MRRNYVRRILCLPSRVTHSLVWILPDCHGIVALLVISGKQPSSELLHTLRFICVCWPPKRQRSISTTSSPQHGSTSCLPGNFLARVTISTNVDDTASIHRARVSHNIRNTLQLRRYTNIATEELPNHCIFGPDVYYVVCKDIPLDIYSAGTYCRPLGFVHRAYITLWAIM